MFSSSFVTFWGCLLVSPVRGALTGDPFSSFFSFPFWNTLAGFPFGVPWWRSLLTPQQSFLQTSARLDFPRISGTTYSGFLTVSLSSSPSRPGKPSFLFVNFVWISYQPCVYSEAAPPRFRMTSISGFVPLLYLRFFPLHLPLAVRFGSGCLASSPTCPISLDFFFLRRG